MIPTYSVEALIFLVSNPICDIFNVTGRLETARLNFPEDEENVPFEVCSAIIFA